MMKRFIALLISILMLCAACPALAETLWVHTDVGAGVSLRHEVTNEVLTVIPDGTALTPDMNKSTDLFAYVTYNGMSGYVLWRYLWRNPDGEQTQPDTQVDQPAPTAEPVVQPVETEAPEAPTEEPAAPTEEPQQPAPDEQPREGFIVQTVGAFVQVADSANKPISDRWTYVQITASDNLIITADIPAGQTVEAWIINGARYEFNYDADTIRVTNVDQDFVFEPLIAGAKSTTQPTAEEIQAGRDGSKLLMVTKNSELCHITKDKKGAGGWLREFDFTYDYENRASGEKEQGGRLTACVSANVPRGKYVMGWKFDETRLYPNRWVDRFIVFEQFASITYEPLFGEQNQTVVWDPDNPWTNWNNDPTHN